MTQDTAVSVKSFCTFVLLSVDSPSMPLVDLHSVLTGQPTSVSVPLPLLNCSRGVTDLSLLYRERAHRHGTGASTLTWAVQKNASMSSEDGMLKVSGLTPNTEYEVLWQAHSDNSVSLPSAIQLARTCVHGTLAVIMPSITPVIQAAASGLLATLAVLRITVYS